MISIYNWPDCFKEVLLKDSDKEELKNNVSTILNELYSQPVKVSRKVYDQIHEKFNYDSESGWMLFSKDGAITEAVEADTP